MNCASFKVSAALETKTIHSFSPNAVVGKSPKAGLVKTTKAGVVKRNEEIGVWRMI